MKSINFYKYILVFMMPATVILAGCEKVTNQVNASGITATNFYKTASDADNAITACYDAFQNPVRYFFGGKAEPIC